MVSSISILGMVFTLIVSIAAPVVLAIILYKRHRYHPLSLVVGAAVFVISQIIIRIPLLSALSTSSWHQQNSSSLIYLLVVYALSAGIFEETGRLIGFRFFRKNHLDWRNAVAFGIGHGGIEAVLLVGMQTVNNLTISLMINSGSFDTLIAPSLGDQAEQVREALTETPPAHFFLAGVERLAVLPVHIILSVIICLAVAKRKYVLVLLAILLHGLVNTPAVMASPYSLSIYVIEGMIIAMSVIAIWAIFRSKRWFPAADPAPYQDVRPDHN